MGDHIRARRLDLGLFQREAGLRIGVTEATVYGWEKLGTSPSISEWPGVLCFLGYDPHPSPTTTGQRLQAIRRREGLTQVELAARLNVDPSTLKVWERGQEPHNRRCRLRVEQVLTNSLVSQPSSL